MDLGICVKALNAGRISHTSGTSSGTQGAYMKEGGGVPGAFALDALRRVWTSTAVRRGLHRAASRLPRRDRLLLSRQRDEVIDRIRVPALTATAEDDPFVPTTTFRDPSVTELNIIAAIMPHGGHWRMSSAPLAATTVIGRTGDRASPIITSRHPERLHQERPKLRPLPRLFVLEVDKHVAAA